MNVKYLLFAAIGAFIGVAGLQTYYHFNPPSGPMAQGEIEQIIREYIVSNPEVLQEAMVEFEKRQTVADTERARETIARNAELLFNSKRDVVSGNPQGDVNLVEFFDYNCPYCKQAMTDLDNLEKSDPKLRIIFKEFPVLGPNSIEVAQVAIALRMQDPSGEKYLAFRRAVLGTRGAADRTRAVAAARDIGADMERLETDLKSDEIRATLEGNFKVAEELGLNGTPSYVIGSGVAVGALGLTALQEKVKQARARQP